MQIIPKMFVISPNVMTERREMAKEHFAERGVEPVFFNGLYGPDMGLSSKFDDPKRPYSRLSSKRICLAINHRFLWTHVALAGLSEAVIFEDDVILPEDFHAYFHEMVAKTPPDWEMVYLGITYPERLEDKRIKATRINESVWRHEGMNTFDGTVDGLWAYMLSAEGARKLAEMRFILNDHGDRWVTFNALRHMKTYIWHPSALGYKPSVKETE